jgi:hypothetical protein
MLVGRMISYTWEKPAPFSSKPWVPLVHEQGIPLKTCKHHPKVVFDGQECPGCQAEKEIPTSLSVDASSLSTHVKHRTIHSFHRTHNNKNT